MSVTVKPKDSVLIALVAVDRLLTDGVLFEKGVGYNLSKAEATKLLGMKDDYGVKYFSKAEVTDEGIETEAPVAPAASVTKVVDAAMVVTTDDNPLEEVGLTAEPASSKIEEV
jgi:hypothetical protein